MQQATHPKYTHKAFVFGLSLGVLGITSAPMFAQGIAQTEAIRRQALTQEAESLLVQGRDAYAKGEFSEAVQKYRTALDKLPGGANTEDRRRAIAAHLADGSVALAQQYRRTGKYVEARELLETVLIADPGNAAARQHLEYLDDPIRTNPALDYEHTQKVDQVRRHLYTGEGYYNLGRYDKAMEEFEAVIRDDPYNTAARRFMARISSARSDYYRAAYDETRARMLAEVDQAWELSVPPAAGDILTPYTGISPDRGGVVYIQNKLRSIIIPMVDFDSTTVEEAIDFLRQRSRELDTNELDPEKKGINFVIRRARVEGGAVDDALDADVGLGASNPGAASIKELKLRNVPIATVLQYICDQAALRYKVDEFAVTLLPASGAEGEDQQTRRWQVPPTFLNDIESGGGDGGGAASDDPFADAGGGGLSSGLKGRRNLIDIFKDKGVTFPDGASASFLPGSSTLVVKNTPTNLDLIDVLVEDIRGVAPKMIKILTKFVEISQENTDELSFDWILSPVGLGKVASDNLFLGGGTVGSGTTRTASDFISPVAGAFIPGIPLGSSQAVSNIGTAGLRSGDSAVTRNSIDAILNNPTRTAQNADVAPGILSLTGLFNDGQFQMIMRGLAQKKGADIMTAPSVTTRPGQKATIEIIREFIYPTEYEPPELAQQNNNNFGGGGGGGGGGGVTPATPTAFETRNIGVTLEIEPNVGANDYVIDLRFAPEIVEFEGFINYGSPITSPAADAFGNPVTLVITENRIEMPVFSSRRVSTGITIYDGHTVAVGGLMREDIQNVEDSVPILGDLPIIGRLFQSKAQNHIKSNLIIFVTARIIDATGRPVRRAESPTEVPIARVSGVGVAGDAGVLPIR
jgi:general secretion pathway protein D